jgi:hypothetical protein
MVKTREGPTNRIEKDEDENQTNDTSKETAEKKDNKNVFCVICEKESSGAH